ncbi:MAG: GyrI-like domain-containing protein [Peptostreptococcaceae bacterium]|nr:GyrI-like domain-containing protein [Peptostreptococcaceae bacterium]
MKYEWRKMEKDLYGVKQKPEIIDVPSQKFITIKGMGNPNMDDFSNRVSALYSLAYSIKMLYKVMMKEESDEKITDFTVYSLEGIWEKLEGDEPDKSKLRYKIMIKQPDFIARKIVENAMENIKKKKPNVLYDEIVFESIQDGKCIQILHVGSYDSEPDSFKKMDKFARESGLMRSSETHREIYLSNRNKTPEDDLKTILRYAVR